MARVSRRNQQEHQGKFLSVPLSGKRPISVYIASYTMESSSVSIMSWSNICTLQTSCVLHLSRLSPGLVSAWILPQHMHPIAAHHQKLFDAFLCGVPTKAVQLCSKADQHMCVLSREQNLSSCILSCACFCRTSSLLYLLQ